MQHIQVENNTTENQFEAKFEGKTALIKYRAEEDGALNLFHTEVPEEFAGRGVGSRLVEAALEQIKADNLKIIPSCAFVAAYLKRHPAYRDLVK